MPTGLVRYHHSGALHFLTFSCFRHRPILGTPQARDNFLAILEQTRLKHCFEVGGYVVMPDHIHLLLSEPTQVTVATTMQVLKQRFSVSRSEEHIWEPRYHDFNIFTAGKRSEKLHYIHQNPVSRGLVSHPADWQWSNYNSMNNPGPVHLTLPGF